MTHWGIIGHEWAVEQLMTSVRVRRIGHAYLFTGPQQVGKTTLALAFAQALNCESDYVESRPCGVCRACRLIANGRHPDVRLLEPELSTRGKPTLKIDDIRELLQYINLAAVEARYKVAIISQFDAATPGAANAFLKTLEEPPNNVILLLTASEADALLPTINSRCRTLALRPLSTGVIAEALQRRWEVRPDDARLLAHLANGRLGWAVGAAAQAELLTEREQQLEQLEEALDGNRVARFALADALARKPEGLPALLQTWLGWWRDCTLLSQGVEETRALINIDQLEPLSRRADAWPPVAVQRSLRQTHAALWQLERNANGRLVLENLLLTYP